MPRKGENIYKRKDGRWEGRYLIERVPNQRARYGSVYARSYREVKEKLLAAKHNTSITRQSNPVSSIDSASVQGIAVQWLDFKSAQIKESTLNKYLITLEYYIYPHIGSMNVTEISKQNIEAFSRTLLSEGKRDGTGLAPKTVSDTISVLNSILAYAVEHGHQIQPGVSSVRIRQKQRELTVLSKKEQKTLSDYLIEHMDLRNLGILLSLFTGLRIGELCALRWEHINLSARTIYICQTLQRLYPAARMQRIHPSDNLTSMKTYISISTPKSSCSIRTIPIPECLTKILEEYEQAAGFLLTGKDCEYIEPRCYQNYFKKVLKQCNIEKMHFHVLRHTFATRCVELGFDVKTLSEILGHANVNITMNRYVHPSMDTKRNNMELLNDLF